MTKKHVFNRSPDQHFYCICGELASASCHTPESASLAHKQNIRNYVKAESPQSEEWEFEIEARIKQLLAYRKWHDDAKEFASAAGASNAFNEEFKKLIAFISTVRKEAYEEGKNATMQQWNIYARALWGKSSSKKALPKP